MIKGTQKSFVGILTLICIISYSQILPAGEIRRYPLESLIQMALGSYQPLEIQKNEIALKREQALHEKRWDNPEAGATVGGKNTGGDSGIAYSVTLSQKFAVSGKKKLASNLSRIEEKEAALALEEMKLALRYEITRLAFAYASDLARARHVKARFKRIKLVSAYLQGHVLIAPQRIVERNIVQARLSRMEMEFLEINKNLSLSYDALNRYLKFEKGAEFSVGLNWFARGPAVDLGELTKRAESDNFDIRSQELAVERAVMGFALAKREIIPDIGLNLFYSGDTMKERERIYGGGVTMALPIFSQNRHGIRKEELNKKSREMTVKYAREKVAQRMKELITEYEFARRMVALYPVDSLDALDRKMDYADAEFRKGRLPIVLYLEMDSALHENIESTYSAQLHLVRTYTDILYMAAVTREINGDIK